MTNILCSTRIVVATTMLFASFFLAAPASHSAGIVISNGQKVAFLGDDITQYGWDDPKGYVHLVVDTLAANSVSIVPIPAGKLNSKSGDLLIRLDSEVLKQKPNWVMLNCGVFDVLYGARGTELAPYMENVTKAVDKAKAAKAQVIILTATPIGEDANNDLNKKLAAYNAFLRDLAIQKGCLLADTNIAMTQVIAMKVSSTNYATIDGVHMNDLGNQTVARAILKAIGLDEAQIVGSIPLPVRPTAVTQAPPPVAAPTTPAVAPTSGPKPPPTAAPAKLVPTIPLPTSGNFAIGMPYTVSDPDYSGWDGLTDGTWSSVGPGAFATSNKDTFPKTITIDLQQSVPLASLITAPVPRSATKTIELSLSQSANSDFKVVGTHEFNQDAGDKYTFSFPATTARYVRLTFPDHYPTSPFGPLFILLQEVEVYGPGGAK